jgi:tetraacyldisaccharide 4'-kinase
VGDPHAFERQLIALGASVESAAYRDHHAFTAADVGELARRAAGGKLAVCTLKDAVKLGPLWPRTAASLWYVSQRMTLESGGGALERLLHTLLVARPAD